MTALSRRQAAARSSDQPSTLRPVSTTSRAAKKRSALIRPYRSRGSAYMPISSHRPAAYSAQPSRYPFSANVRSEVGTRRIGCSALFSASSPICR